MRQEKTSVKERQTATGAPMLIVLDFINFGEVVNVKATKLFKIRIN